MTMRHHWRACGSFLVLKGQLHRANVLRILWPINHGERYHRDGRSSNHLPDHISLVHCKNNNSVITSDVCFSAYLTGDDNHICLLGVCLLIT